jgi:hypothetical protein
VQAADAPHLVERLRHLLSARILPALLGLLHKGLQPAAAQADFQGVALQLVQLLRVLRAHALRRISSSAWLAFWALSCLRLVA